jgi:hypothetical protein
MLDLNSMLQYVTRFDLNVHVTERFTIKGCLFYCGRNLAPVGLSKYHPTIHNVPLLPTVTNCCKLACPFTV